MKQTANNRELFNACQMDDPQKDTSATATANATTEPDITPPEEDREIEKSPSQRFIKYDREVGRGSFKTVYKALDTTHAQPVAWLELQPHKLTKEDRHRFKVSHVMSVDSHHGLIGTSFFTGNRL